MSGKKEGFPEPLLYESSLSNSKMDPKENFSLHIVLDFRSYTAWVYTSNVETQGGAIYWL